MVIRIGLISLSLSFHRICLRSFSPHKAPVRLTVQIANVSVISSLEIIQIFLVIFPIFPIFHFIPFSPSSLPPTPPPPILLSFPSRAQRDGQSFESSLRPSIPRIWPVPRHTFGFGRRASRSDIEDSLERVELMPACLCFSFSLRLSGGNVGLSLSMCV